MSTNRTAVESSSPGFAAQRRTLGVVARFQFATLKALNQKEEGQLNIAALVTDKAN